MMTFDSLPDIPRAVTALAEWLACMQCILVVRRRYSGIRLATISLGVLAVQTIFLVVTGSTPKILWFLCMFLAVALMYGFIRLCTEENVIDAAYYCIRSFVIAEFAASLEWQLVCYVMHFTNLPFLAVRIVVLIAVFGVVYPVFWFLYRDRTGMLRPLNITTRELLGYGFVGLAIFAMSNLGFLTHNTLLGGQLTEEIYSVRTLVDMGGVAMMYAFHTQLVDLRIRHELESVQAILHTQYTQYQQSREAVDLINYKYHDLKHHIIALRAEDNMEVRNAHLDRMEEELEAYELQNKTGNKVLDVLLTSKSLYCRKHGITLTSVIDGKLFDFMDAMDICSIFGNALDNAIECERKIPDKQKRLIHVAAYSQKSFLLIGFENYYEGTLEYEGDLPSTTKRDEKFHGYGLKSLRYTVHNYGGEVDISVRDNWFILKILIPL